MPRVKQAPATLEDLYREPGKAELVGGRIVRFMPTGSKPGRVAGRIYRSLDDFAEQSGRCEAYPGNVGYAISILPSGRQSFSPDASYFLGTLPENPMRFLDGPPTFAAEVRSADHYGEAALEPMAEKRSDYFAAGTLVVWDVDPIEECVHVYRATAPEQPTTYRRGQTAEAEPAMPGWRVSVNWIFAAKNDR